MTPLMRLNVFFFDLALCLIMYLFMVAVFAQPRWFLSFNHVCLAFFDLVTSFIKYVSPPWSLMLSSLFYLFLLVYVVPLLLIICRCSHCLFQSLFWSAWPPTLASLCAEAHSRQFSKLSPSSHLNNSCHKLSQSLSFGKRYETERNCISISLFTKGW